MPWQAIRIAERTAAVSALSRYGDFERGRNVAASQKIRDLSARWRRLSKLGGPLNWKRVENAFCSSLKFGGLSCDDV